MRKWGVCKDLLERPLKAIADGLVGQVLAGSVSEFNKKLITMTMLM